MSKGILAALMCWWCLGAGEPVHAQQTAAVAVFPLNSIEQVDVRNQLLTFKSQDGQVRILRVAEGVGITRTSFAKGDLVRIEVDLDERIITIVKVSEPSPDRRAARLR